MSVKIYEAYIIKNINFSDFSKDFQKLKRDMIKKIREDYIKYYNSFGKKLLEQQKENGFIKSTIGEFNVKIRKEEQELIFFLEDYIRLASKSEYMNSICSIFKFQVCFFPYEEHMLFIPFFNNQEYKNILNKAFLNIEDFSYYDNSDAPYEEYEENDENYVSKENWEYRKKAWQNVLTEEDFSIPSLNSLQLNLNHTLFASPLFVLDYLDEEIRKGIVNIKNIEKKENL